MTGCAVIVPAMLRSSEIAVALRAGSLRLGRHNEHPIRCDHCGAGQVYGGARAAVIDGTFAGWLCDTCQPEELKR